MLHQLSQLPIETLTLLGLLLGLLIGSFLNVVIVRFPNMMMHAWTLQSRDWLKIEVDSSATAPPSLAKPGSHCPHCKTPIKAWQNIPLLSWFALGGKCGQCKTAISIRYPLVELLSGVLSAVVVYKFGWSAQSMFGMLLTWVLIALAFIDFDHKLLPDEIVLPTLWLGLALSLWPVFTLPHNAIIGAIAGYLSFWVVFQVFLKLTGKEGMGYGDFKLMGLLGAWLGWEFLPQIILISTILGSIVGITLMVFKKASGELAIPFGPYIALAGWVAMLWGNELNLAYLNFTGLS